MAGFGGALGGLGQAGNAYAGFMNQDAEMQLNQQKVQQAIQQMQQQKAAQAAQQQALIGLANLQGSGPGGVITPQQLAGLTQNPQAYAALNTAIRPANQGLFGMQDRQISGQYGLDRTQLAGDNAMDRTQVQQDAANQRNEASNKVRQAIVEQQQTGANARNEATNKRITTAKTFAPQNIAASPEYRTAKSEYEEAKKDERNIEAHYPLVSQAYNDPQWLEARKRSIAAQTKLEAIHSKAAAAPASTAGLVKIANDDDYNKLSSGTSFLDPEGNLRTKPYPEDNLGVKP